MYEGRFHDALAQLRESALTSQAGKDWLRVARTRLILTTLFQDRGDTAGARRELDLAAQVVSTLPGPPVWIMARIGVAYARLGEGLKADSLLVRVRSLTNAGRPAELGELHMLEGESVLSHGDLKAAVELLQTADREAHSPLTAASLARAYDRAGDAGQAIATLERLVGMRGRALGWEAQQPWIDAHVRLAELHTIQGHAEKGVPYLDAVSRIWLNADRELPSYQQIQRLLRGRQVN